MFYGDVAVPRSAFSVFNGTASGATRYLPPGYSRLRDLGQFGDGPVLAPPPASTIAGRDDQPQGAITTVPTDPQSLKQAIDDAAWINGTPVFKSDDGMLGILDGRVTRNGENSWSITDGTIGVIEGERAQARSFKGLEIIIRQDPQTGAITYEEE
jgi:hypothetical protein